MTHVQITILQLEIIDTTQLWIQCRYYPKALPNMHLARAIWDSGYPTMDDRS